MHSCKGFNLAAEPTSHFRIQEKKVAECTSTQVVWGCPDLPAGHWRYMKLDGEIMQQQKMVISLIEEMQ